MKGKRYLSQVPQTQPETRQDSGALVLPELPQRYERLGAVEEALPCGRETIRGQGLKAADWLQRFTPLPPRGTNSLSRPANTIPATNGCSFLGTPVGRSARRPRVAATVREGVDRKRGQPMLALVVTAKDVPESPFGVLGSGLFETFHSQILNGKAAGDAGECPGSRQIEAGEMHELRIGDVAHLDQRSQPLRRAVTQAGQEAVEPRCEFIRLEHAPSGRPR